MAGPENARNGDVVGISFCPLGARESYVGE